MNDAVVVGIGNAYRSDDGAGWAVVDALQKTYSKNVAYKKLGGDVAQLLDIFSKFSIVYLVDACCSDRESWRRFDVSESDLFMKETLTSSHGFGVSQAIALAKNLDLMPKKIIIYAIFGKRFIMGDCMSSSVADAIPHVVAALIKELDICTKRELRIT